ncbi:MmcQ/YjbR family DNA-binding protein [Aeromicrobium piscarium]|uniref:MmcQ/YjbR family DNA-binding protein n=1 Tax=Aeromicrobium piscarium TaxID=2590901 RepID=A0A554SQE8_9ACTN|nr:MmcQ/YjbR family DNA-binding protein [Aeromicrobium piscarium]TSD68479.1 hypothetical protein FNM00_02500 [Aeromicrobium piscarium]
MTWDEIVAYLLEFPSTELTTTWNMPAVKAGGVLVAWWRDAPDSPGSVAFKVAPDELEALLGDPDAPYYTIDHFRKFGTNAVLVRPGEADADELRELLTEAWLAVAKPRVRKAWLAEHETR